ncbi:hypothetical protein [Ornithinibacillus bavariensis]|uniref:Uncharacterized protein n=1 Tax=Ornithinibacillus bavariensis TaxID=545502 RepID=A0A919X4W6_9BACI|nr:hypothetical protein [Ornithinibacillus bavariensis]GIO25576.1 hypothetical protein J43TS3_01870 [Ornithinibacillus bavariensis]HAM82052.1 hypothetical protein [Ornithinibacillus sp.]
MRFILELARIILIFGLLGAIFSSVLKYVYQSFGVIQYEWLGYIAILLLLFVAYRNKWQFSGWYKGKGREKLPQSITNLLVSFSVALLIVPSVFSYIL